MFPLLRRWRIWSFTAGHTDWISGFGSFDGLNVWSKPEAVLGPDAEQVLLTPDQVWNHQRLSSAGRVHLRGQTVIRNKAHEPASDRQRVHYLSITSWLRVCYPAGVLSYLGPGFAIHRLLLDKVALHSLSSVTLRRFPGESAGSPCHITHLQVSRRSRQVCGKKRIR